jgi:hypothetical protein
MTIGLLNFSTPAPGFLAFGAVAASNTLTISGTFPALSGTATFDETPWLRISGTFPALTGVATFGDAPWIRISGTLPALSGSATLGESPYWLTIGGTLPALTGRSYLAIPVYPPRGPARRILPTWHRGALQAADPLHSLWRVATRQPLGQVANWHNANRISHCLQLQAAEPVQASALQCSWWNSGSLLSHAITITAGNPAQQVALQRSPWGNADPLGLIGGAGTLYPVITPIAQQSPWHNANRLHVGNATNWQTALPMPELWRSWWSSAMPPPPGIRYRPPPVVPPLRPKGRLDFRCPAPGVLAFGSGCFGSAGWLVTIKEVYRVLNSGSLIRISDGADIAVSDMTIDIDRNSWCWTLSASLIGREAADRATERTEVEATINGFQWRFVLDSQTRSREFATCSGTAHGRSLAAWLSAPYAAPSSLLETEAKTAEQLALQALPLGWFLDWQLPTWTVPGRVWQYQNLTVIEAINRIAKSAGGIVQADPVTQKLWLSKRWPVRPWNWSTSTPFATLPSAYCTKEEREGIPGTPFEAIMIYGGADNGEVVMATRAGQAGLLVAEPVNDSLITDIEPGKERAAQELADQWPLRQFSISLPLQAQPAGAGLIQPGLFFDFSDGLDGWRGLVTAVSIRASFGTVTQTVTAVSA